MAITLKITGTEKLLAALKAKAEKARVDLTASISVGYAKSYAVYVHENLEAHHNVGQAKFLEQPAREMKREMAEIVKDALKSGKTMAQALMLAGLALQRASQQLVPVDTGALKASAFTRVNQ